MASSSLYDEEILDMLSTDSPLLTPPPKNKLPALMADDKLPITDPRPFYASPYEKLPKSLEYTDFRSAFYPDIKRPDYNTTLQLQWTNLFTI